jgi:hypothetical protein
MFQFGVSAMNVSIWFYVQLIRVFNLMRGDILPIKAFAPIRLLPEHFDQTVA